jgi:hypothetical protein
MTQIRYLRKMAAGVPVVAAPAQIDITTAEQRARLPSPRLAAASYEEARAGGLPRFLFRSYSI